MINILTPHYTKIFFYYEFNLYKKEMFLQNKNAIKIYCIGTPLYREKNIESNFEKILNDFFSNKLKYNELKGNFLIIFVKNKEIKIFSDKTQQHHLFYEKNTKTFSTSFLELVKLNQEKLELNTYGFYEKISIGFHLGEETLFNNIIRILPENTHKFDTFKIEYISNHIFPKINEIKFHDNGKKDSINKQKQHLSQYFSLINESFKGKTGDLGLSGGFDCRLILALAQKNITQLLHLHTHATKGIHDDQSKFADKLAKKYGTNLTRVITTSPSNLNDASFTKMLNDNLEFFDGRSARHIGAYSQTYTENYKRESMGKADYSLNGLGGEIYRDSYFTGSKKMIWDEWAERYLFLEGAKAIVPKNELQKISMSIKSLLEKKLHWDKDYYDILFTHAYYGLIKMPLCNGSVISAYNKVSPFLLPFIEYDNVIEALKAIPYLGIGGQYQAKLITSISPELATLPTSYGRNYKSLGLKYYLWSLIKTLGSIKHRNAIVLKRMITKADSSRAKIELNHLNELKEFKNSITTIKNIDNHINLNIALIESTQKRNIISLGFFLRKYL